MSDALGVAVVGLGVGEQHARTFRALPQCQLKWLCDLDLSKAHALAAELQVPGVTADFQTVLADPAVQIISIASYDDAHAAQVVAALRAGKHVFVEKPLCQTEAELQQIQRAWAEAGGRLKLASNLVLRAAPLYQWLRAKIQAGDFGQIYAFDGEYLYGRLHKLTDGWRRDVEHYSVMHGGGIHLIDLMLWLLGERPTTATAFGNRLATADTKFRYEDFVAASLQMPSGLAARIVANFGCVQRHQHVVRIYGTRATFLYDDAGPRLHLTRDPAVAASMITLAPLPPSKGALIPAFVAAVQNDTALDAETQSFLDGLTISAACDRALHSRQLEQITYL